MQRNNITYCRKLRKNQTDAENRLWYLLRDRRFSGIKFRRQFSAAGYILDFYCPKYRLAIEADGGQHYEKSGRHKDRVRTKELSKDGIRIIRFSDYDILTNTEGVSEVIHKVIEKQKVKNSPHPK